ncbi:MAG TPA: MFS transporter [Nocardioidaceae bacterium]|nr:MFS transporter [Nocardioidaceae bacterium]
MSPLTVRAVYWRYLVLTAVRWLPVGLLIPVIVLLPLERGLSLSELGLAASLQGFAVLALELPTGGLADSLGRRRVLLLSSVVGITSMVIYLGAESFAAFATAFALQGVYRALDSGPLEAWYVDSVHAADPAASIDRGLSAHGVVLGLSVAGGALASGGLIALGPLAGLDAMAVPVVVSLVLQVAGLVGIAVLMVEEPPASGARTAVQAVRDTPRTIAEGVLLLRRSKVLMAIICVELFWGFGMVAFESLTPVRLTEIVGDADQAAVITGPASSAAWLASAAGAACMPWVGRRLGIAPAAALMRILQGLTVVGLGLFGGVVGVITAYLACYAVHGAANPAHMTLLHRQVEGNLRATVVSLNSMMALPAASVGAIALTALADGASVSIAMYVGAAVLAVAAPLYIPAWRQERGTRAQQLSVAEPA